MNRKKNLSLTGRLALALLVFGISSGDSEAQVEVTPDQTYLLLATESTGTMEEELGEAAALGFRVVTAAPTSGNELVLFLERVTEPPDTYDYRLLATTRTSTLQEELEAGAAEGFRFLSRTPICKSRRFGGDEIVVILERAPGDAQQYEYQLLATSRTSTLQDEVSDAVATGFAMSAIVSCGEHLALMERQAP